MRETLKLLRGEAEILNNRLKEIKEHETELLIGIYEEESGFCKGHVVYYDGKLGKITGYRRSWKDISPIVTMYKKDMTLGKAVREAWQEHKLQKFSK